MRGPADAWTAAACRSDLFIDRHAAREGVGLLGGRAARGMRADNSVEQRRKVPSQAVRSSSSGTSATPWMLQRCPLRVDHADPAPTAAPRAVHISVNRSSSVRGTATSTRPADSENSCTNGSMVLGAGTPRAPVSPIRHISTMRLGQAAVGQVVRGRHHAVAGAGHQDLAQQLLARPGRPAAGAPPRWPWIDAGPLRTVQLVPGFAQQQQRFARLVRRCRSGCAGRRRRSRRARRSPGSAGSPCCRSGCRS